MHAQAATSPICSRRVQTNVPRMRTPHMPMILNTKGAIVLPVPCSMPSRMMATPKNGSDTATIRRTVTPSAIT